MRIDEILTESWSQKYKNSINCSHPKGFSQKAHCAGKKKHNESIEMEMTCPDCGMCETHGDNLVEVKQRLDAKCWKGKHKEGTKIKGGVRVNNCVPNESLDANQKRVGQVGGKEKAKKIGTVLGTAPKQHPFKGRLVGEDVEDSPGTTEHYNGIEIYLEDYGDGEIFVQATASGKELGYVLFVKEGEFLVPKDLEVNERFRGQGVAQTMYDYVKSKGYRIRRSPDQTDAGAAFWDKHKPGKNVWEQQVKEVAPPGMEDWIKDRKADFKKRYGDKWEQVLYATAWKHKKNESLEEGYGKYWCSTDKRWKERKGPKQTRKS